MTGLKKGIVKLKKYNKKWKDCFENEKKLLTGLIGKLIIDIQHVGSTSIPGCSAKPIIDIAAGIKKIKEVKGIIDILKSNAYEYKNEAGIPGRHFFVKDKKDKRTHHLHVEEYNSNIWLNHILFRDYLIKHQEKIKEYNDLKKILCAKYKKDREEYTNQKTFFIQNIINDAKKELKLIR